MSKRRITCFNIGDKVKVRATYFDDDAAVVAGKLEWFVKEFGTSFTTFMF